MGKPSISFFIMIFIILFVVIGFKLIVFDLHRFAFVIELMVLLVFIFLLTFSMHAVYNNKAWGWTLAGVTLILLLINTFFILLLKRTFETPHITTIFFSVVGLVIVLLNLKRGREPDESKIGGHGKVTDYYPYIDKMEPKEEQISKGQETKVEKKFTPGKFVASKKANKFHTAKCDWAGRISRENQLWFNSKEEAQSKGFQADRCVV